MSAVSAPHAARGWIGSDLALRRDAAAKGIDPGKIVPRRALRIFIPVFSCPYCGRQWNRGGQKEGFVKAGATLHVESCYEILLWQAGYLEIYGKALKITIIDSTDEMFRRRKRNITAMIARRRKEGWQPRSPK